MVGGFAVLALLASGLAGLWVHLVVRAFVAGWRLF
jgi:hypothetical protein